MPYNPSQMTLKREDNSLQKEVDVHEHAVNKTALTKEKTKETSCGQK